MEFPKRKSCFYSLARFVLCLVLCVNMLGTNGVFGAMPAFCDETTHKYKLVDVTPVWTPDVPAPYGHVINYKKNGTELEKKYQKVVTADEKHWGQYEGNPSQIMGEKYYVWHTGDGTQENPNRLDGSDADNADIKVVYDNAKPAGERTWASWGGETVFVDMKDDETGMPGAAMWNTNDCTNFDVNADFIGNHITKDIDWGYGAAFANSNKMGNVIGDFVGNWGEGISGGAIGNFENVDGAGNPTIGAIGNITGDFIGNYAKNDEDVYGGAIFNGSGATIKDITGDFIGNYVVATTLLKDYCAYGGAIYNTGRGTTKPANIGDITGNFIDNYASSANSNAYGGAIYNTGRGAESAAVIGAIMGDFIGNYTFSTNFSAYGGAIYNTTSDGEPRAATIGDITGDFIGNYAYSTNSGADGGAIFNTTSGEIGNIKGNFLGNYVSSTGHHTPSYGGAIYNGSTMGSVEGDFVENYVRGNDEVGGGAIDNAYKAKLGDITGNFIGNYVQSDSNSAYGGAVFNNSYGELGNITGDFLGNYAMGAKNAYGGAIRNYVNSTIEYIKGDFIGNYAKGTTNAQGGAINNEGEIDCITGSFIENYAQSDSGNAKGGAIRNKATITLLASEDILFSGNTADLGGAIYNIGTGEKGVYLRAAEGKSITFVGNDEDEKVDSVHNEGNLSINAPDGSTTYTGTINFAKITDTDEPTGTITINAGTVNIKGDITQKSVSIAENASLIFTGNTELEIGSILNKGNISIAEGGVVIGNFNFDEASTVKSITYSGTLYPLFDASDTSSTNMNLTLNNTGIINMNDKDWDGESPRNFRTLNISAGGSFTANGGTFVINTDLANPTPDRRGDRINVDKVINASATAKVKVAYDPAFLTGKGVSVPDGTGHVFFNAEDSGSIKFTAETTRWNIKGKTIEYKPTLQSEEGDFAWRIMSLTAKEIKEETGEETKAVADTANAINMAWFETANNLQKRLGDLRGGAASNTGWARFQRSNDDHNGARKLNVSGNLYQIGYDFALKNDEASRGYFGLSLERFDGTQSFNIGNGDLKSTSLGVYYTKLYNSGHYFDLIFRYGRYESDTTSLDASADNPALTKLDYAVNGVTFSGEYGYRKNLGKSGLYIEPQAEFIYGYLSGAKKTSNTGILADIDSTNHFVSRLGLAFGQKVKNFNYYLRGSYYHDFAGSTNITYGDASYKEDSAQNWWEVSLGGGWNMSDKSYFYAELTKHFKDISNSLNFNLGFRFTL